MTLTPEEQVYLSLRGFEVVEGTPSVDEQYPHVVLREEQQTMAGSEIEYRQARGIRDGTTGILHPKYDSSDMLVGVIEETVASCMCIDGEVFSTQPGKPIKVFVEDAAWMPVAQALVARFSQTPPQ